MEKMLRSKLICSIAFVGMSLMVIIVPCIAKVISSMSNNYPVVLCHGWRGYSSDENFGEKLGMGKLYWGGTEDKDIQRIFEDYGFSVLTAKVGPYSSNWDRACELYAQIKGGRVDYGAKHSASHGHSYRYGRCYEGWYPEWGTLDSDGKMRKIHLVAHSQGGQTVRILVKLLEEGDPEEVAESGSNASDLFRGGKQWVHSVATLASPHDGTTAADASPVTLLKQWSCLGADSSTEDLVFDTMLDQFDLVRQPDESFSHFMARVMLHPMWQQTGESADYGLYDLSTQGGFALNQKNSAQKDIYYFSWACIATKINPLSELGHHIADEEIMGDKGKYNMDWFTQAAVIGSTGGGEWWPNDGYVNTISENGPKCGSHDVIVDFDGTPRIGKWNFMGTKNMDHEDIVGRNWDADEICLFYQEMAKLLAGLPVAD